MLSFSYYDLLTASFMKRSDIEIIKTIHSNIKDYHIFTDLNKESWFIGLNKSIS